MKPGIGPQVQPGRGSEIRINTQGVPVHNVTPDLSAGELEVLELLRRVDGALTAGQLGARLPASTPVQETLRLLLERGLVARLNTIVPSYTNRQAGAGVHAE